MRVLLCVGCNEYDDAKHLPPLGSAESDARRIFEALTKSDLNIYDRDQTVVLRSPTLDRVRSELSRIARSGQRIDVLTFFFAGHASVDRGSLYLCLKDSESNCLSVSALAMSEVLRLVANLQIAHTNIVLDACETGGLLVDLPVLLKRDAMGAATTPSVTFLAMAASDQQAFEDDEGGFGTQALLACIEGQHKINTIHAHLDLLEIGREVAGQFRLNPRQSPVLWGLNISAFSAFCYNPHFRSKDKTLPNFVDAEQASDIQTSIKPFIPELWAHYLKIRDEWCARSFYELIAKIISPLRQTPHIQCLLIRQLAETFVIAAQEQTDQMVVAEVFSAAGLCLMAYSVENEETDACVAELFRKAKDAAAQKLMILAEHLKADDSFLVRGVRVPYEFFYLPIRLLKILGWSAGVYLMSDESEKSEARRTFDDLLETILDHYSLSLIAISEIQSPYLAIIGAIFRESEQTERLERLLSPIYHSLAINNGRISSISLDGTKAFDYLCAKVSDELDKSPELIAQPSEFIAVCMRLSSFAGLQDVFDDMLHLLDRTTINTYLPDQFRNIGADTIESGQNYSMRIGHEIFTVAEFEQNWPTSQNIHPSGGAELHGAILASLVFPDRTPWFLIPCSA